MIALGSRQKDTSTNSGDAAAMALNTAFQPLSSNSSNTNQKANTVSNNTTSNSSNQQSISEPVKNGTKTQNNSNNVTSNSNNNSSYLGIFRQSQLKNKKNTSLYYYLTLFSNLIIKIQKQLKTKLLSC